jgi:hypothetical protein
MAASLWRGAADFRYFLQVPSISCGSAFHAVHTVDYATWSNVI